MNNIYLATEECITDNQIIFICSKYFESVGAKFSYSKFNFKQLSQNTYEVSGVTSNMHDKVFIIIAKGNGSFIDILLYDEPTSIDLNKKSPKIACEVTKNLPNTKESGNMTSQRLSKWATIQNSPLFASTRKMYLIDYKRKFSTKEVCPSNDKSFAIMSAYNVEVFFKSVEDTKCVGFTPSAKISKLSDLNHSGRTNKVVINQSDVIIETNLYKNKTKKSGYHDPNTGWLTGIVGAIRLFDKNIPITVKSNRPTSEVIGQNKLSKVLYEANAKMKYGNLTVSAPKQTNKKAYWVPETIGEKLGSISLEFNLRNQGKEIIFSNHAGCEKSFVKVKNGSLEQSQKGRGIPDIVYLDNGKLIAVEAEKYKNYKAGLKQVNQKEFKDWIVREFSSYAGHEVEVYVSTNKENDSRKHVIYDGFGNYNSTKPVYKLILKEEK
jgi:hypothetical protein|tara:strand:- start:1608 stop:2915 length:1308 start_codon:yes stop_codon:yes gene_type:complete